MSEHPAPPPPPPPPPRRIVVLRTITDILKQTTSILSTTNNLLMLLLLSLILLSVRASVETAAHFLTSFIDNDPSIKSTINRYHGPPNSTSPTTSITTTRLPFLQLTPVETLDDDFDQLFFDSSLPKPQSNDTSFILDYFDPELGFSNFGIRASEAVRSGSNMTFRLNDGSNDSANESTVSKSEFWSFWSDFWSFWFDLDYHELTSMLFLTGAFFVSYWFVVLGGIIATYATVHGVIFVIVLNDYCKRHNSIVVTFSNGSFLGVKRVIFFINMKWLVREFIAQLLGFWFFQSVTDPYSNMKINLMYKLMPFSFMCFWDKVHEKEVHGFLASWVLLDLFISYAFALTAWILMADPRKSCKRVLNEGFLLLSLMIHSSISLKLFEVIVCGPYARLLLAQTFGDLIAIAFQSFMEVLFMVVWMVYYLSAKSIDAESRGQPFGQRELEAIRVHVR